MGIEEAPRTGNEITSHCVVYDFGEVEFVFSNGHQINPFSFTSHSGMVKVPSSFISHCDFGSQHSVTPSETKKAALVSCFLSRAMSIKSLLPDALIYLSPNRSRYLRRVLMQ